MLPGINFFRVVGLCFLLYSGAARAHRFDYKSFLNKNYDKTVRPGDGNTTIVKLFFHVNTIGSISGISMDYSLDLYLTQSWHDQRLALNGTQRVTLSQFDHRKIWWPDTYFYNAKRGLRHEITTANEFVHLWPNGTVTTSQRLSLSLYCFMDLHDFPMDAQDCHVIIGSYGYVDHEIRYEFVSDRSTTFNENVTLPEFNIDQENVGQTQELRLYSSGNYSILTFTFFLERDFGYYLIQTYIPSIMVVILSWVNFWLDVYATPARISLGLLTVLTMSTQISGINAQLPRVSYVKAIDVWMSTCLLFVFGALLEFAFVNVATRRDEGKSRREKLKAAEAAAASATANECKNNNGDDEAKKERTSRKSGFEVAVWRLLQERRDALRIKNARRVEKTCRFAFPATFGIFVVFYWLHYWCKWFSVKDRCWA